eukprot:6694877-Prymnesium_polylepis.1
MSPLASVPRIGIKTDSKRVHHGPHTQQAQPRTRHAARQRRHRPDTPQRVEKIDVGIGHRLKLRGQGCRGTIASNSSNGNRWQGWRRPKW